MEIDHTHELIKDVFGMNMKEARLLDDLLKTNDLSNILELGFAHGVSSCYFASTLKDMGKGHLTTIDNTTAKTREPNIEELLKKTGLEEYVTYYFEAVSYNWRLMKLIEENDGPIFDFCYIDGAHDWNNDGFAFLLVDKLLKPGGYIIFDDYNWSFSRSPSMSQSPRVLAMSKEEQETPQIKKVYDMLVKTHPNYHNFKILNDNSWALAQKKEEEDLFENQVNKLESENRKLRKKQKEVLDSNSWKMTKPLRSFRKKL